MEMRLHAKHRVWSIYPTHMPEELIFGVNLSLRTIVDTCTTLALLIILLWSPSFVCTCLFTVTQFVLLYYSSHKSSVHLYLSKIFFLGRKKYNFLNKIKMINNCFSLKITEYMHMLNIGPRWSCKVFKMSPIMLVGPSFQIFWCSPSKEKMYTLSNKYHVSNIIVHLGGSNIHLWGQEEKHYFWLQGGFKDQCFSFLLTFSLLFYN